MKYQTNDLIKGSSIDRARCNYAVSQTEGACRGVQQERAIGTGGNSGLAHPGDFALLLLLSQKLHLINTSRAWRAVAIAAGGSAAALV